MTAYAAPGDTIFTPIAIIGSGFAGIGMGIRLQQEGFNDFLILEQADTFGGTWRDNTYPGAECDVPSHLYSFSFEPNPNWSKAFAPQAEIQQYLLRCADKHQLAAKTLFNAKVEAASFNEKAGEWLCTLADGRKVRSRMLVLGCGNLSKPAVPNIDGLQSFAGTVMHTARWQKDFDAEGKRIAVIGTGASAIQTIPELAKQAAHLIVFQRTPSWVMPKFDGSFANWQKQLFGKHPVVRKALRYGIYWGTEALSLALVWNTPLSRSLQSLGEYHLRNSVKDPELRARLTPDYKVGCKRMLISNDYYPALQQPNVSLVTDSIAKVVPKGVVTSDGVVHEVDTLVLATGFQVGVAGTPFPIHGLEGRSLALDWQQGSEAYKGVTVSGFPNLCFIMGPNTGPGHTSVLVYMEGQINYILRYAQTLFDFSYRYLDIKQKVQNRFNQMVQQRMQYTTWTSGCHSWYLTTEGKNTSLWPGFASEYRLRTWIFHSAEYHCVGAKHMKSMLNRKKMPVS